LFGRAANPALGRSGDGPAQAAARARYLEGLRTPAPVSWLSPHLREAQSDFGPVYVALKVLMGQAASAAVRVFRWKARAGSKDAQEYLPRAHPICKLLERPNRWDTGRTMRARIVQQRGLTGSWLGWMVSFTGPAYSGPKPTPGIDTPDEIWTVPTGTYTAIPMSGGYPEGAFRIMPFYPGPMALIPGTWQAGGVIVPAQEMLVSRHPHPLVYKEGLSPLAACAEEVDTASKIGRARNSILGRAPVPAGVIELDNSVTFPDLSELQRLSCQIYAYMGGPDRAGKPAILGPGQKWKREEISGLELPWGETWEQLLDFIFAVIGSTRTMVGLAEAGSYAALYAILKQRRLMVLQPELDDIADCFNSQMIRPWFGEEYGVAFEPEAVGDDELKEKQYALDLQIGLRTFNEWRQIRRLAPVEGPKGQEWVRGGAGRGALPAGREMERDALNVVTPREPKDPMNAGFPRHRSGEGSLPPRGGTAFLRRDHLNGNGKR
jgi:hypothetical protein